MSVKVFEKLLLERAGTLLPPGSRVLCALSGGADSVAMTRGITALRDALQLGQIAVAHFNHGLRGESSEGDQTFCKRLCEKLDIPLITGKAGQNEYNAGSGKEAAYRRARYAFLTDAAEHNEITHVVTAHTADDNAETLLLNLTRGTGLAGLAGIPEDRPANTVRIVRPMLNISRAEVLEYLTALGQDYRSDESNDTDDYRRNRVRRHIIPFLLKENPALLNTLSRTSALLKNDADYLDRQSRAALEEIATAPNGVSLLKLSALHPALAGRVVRLLCTNANGTHVELTQRHISAVLALCNSAPSAAADLPSGLTARRVYDILIIEKNSPCLTFEPVSISFGQTVLISETGLTASWTEKPKKVNNLVYSFLLSSDTIESGLIIRPRAEGDSMRPAHRGHTKSLRRIFIDSKIPKHERGSIPVLACEAGVVAAAGFGVDKRYVPTGTDRGTVLQIYR